MTPVLHFYSHEDRRDQYLKTKENQQQQDRKSLMMSQQQTRLNLQTSSNHDASSTVATHTTTTNTNNLQQSQDQLTKAVEVLRNVKTQMVQFMHTRTVLESGNKTSGNTGNTMLRSLQQASSMVRQAVCAAEVEALAALIRNTDTDYAAGITLFITV